VNPDSLMIEKRSEAWILVVEDDANIAELLRRGLKRAWRCV
jgi:hypothetical protein